MSGHASYSDSEFQRVSRTHRIPLFRATAGRLRGLGNLVADYGEEEVIINPWPMTGSRPLASGTGKGGGFAEGPFICQYEKDLLRASNLAVEDEYVVGKRVGDFLLTREANYHPDGGQVIVPTTDSPFILLLAPPGDEVKPESFRAFLFEERMGFQIHPGVWHQPPIPLVPRALFENKQSAVHGCVIVDTVNEEGVWLQIPLSLEEN